MQQPKFIDSEFGSKINQVKKNIIRFYINNGSSTIAELSKQVDLSVPTTTKIISELIEEGFVQDFGKQETDGGRRPNLYGLNPDSGYFVGVNVRLYQVDFVLLNFKGEAVTLDEKVPFRLENTPDSLDEVCRLILEFISIAESKASKILAVGVNITGRVNSKSGYSYSYFYFGEKPLAALLQEKVGIPCFVDNDTRAMAYGEYMYGVGKGEKNMIFVNVSWGVGIGIIMDGKLYYGKSGFAGEFGHFNTFDNEIICRCGKKGCLETEASGLAIQRILKERVEAGSTTILQERIESGSTLMLEDIIQATLDEDVLSIEIIEEVGNKLGRAIAGLINVFNPETLVIGGAVAATGDYIMLPIKSAINKYSLNLVNKDTELRLTKLGDKAGLIGICLLARELVLGI